MIKRFITIVFFFSALLISQDQNIPICGTPNPTESETALVNERLESLSIYNQRTPDDEPVNVLVAWHVIHNSGGQGNIPDNQIQAAVDILNYQYNEVFNFYFTLDTITRHENDDWYTFEPNEQSNQSSDEQQMRSQTVTDPVHYYNIWSVLTQPEDGWIVLGWNYFPFSSSEDSYWQGTTINYSAILGGTLEHEAGHYFGLYHTFQGNCSGSNDQVSDTPAMHYDGIYSCDLNQDTCPNLEGNDPVTNIMNYTDCAYDFTPGQGERGYSVTETYHPGLLENEFHYPNLDFSSMALQGDTDGDGVLNPGDSAQIRINIVNYWGVDADNILLTLTTDDERLVIIDSTVLFEDPLSTGEISFGPVMDLFHVYAQDGITMGSIDCNLNITTNNEQYPYNIDLPVEVSIRLNQSGFPVNGMVIKSSPIISDLDGNMTQDIFFGSDDGKFYGYMSEGVSMYGFPFSTDGDIRSSPAIVDLDNDGNNEIIFGSNDGKLYILDAYGNQELAYVQSGVINGSPAIVDLDLDGDYEIIFTTYGGINSNGEVYAIHHDGNDVDGFPIGTDEKMMVGAAVGDLEGDGFPEIVICTWDDNIYAIDNTGMIKEGFPFASTNRFNAPATLVDLDGDGDLEIVAGNDSGLLHVIEHDGEEMTSYDVGDDIRGGISVADLNDDGSSELIFAGYDDMIHVWNPMDGEELDGWPIDMGYNSLTEPVTADLDNDGDLEVISAMKSGMVYIFHHDATSFNNFPTNLSGNIESSPAIGDLDNDNDYEIIFGTTQGLQVLDIKTEKGSRESWKLHRGNLNRSGLFSLTLVAVDNLDNNIPENFFVSPNYPNPFNPSTKIDIATVVSDHLIVSIYDASGRLLDTIIDENLEAGYYSLKWHGKDKKGQSMPTGVYFIQVRSGEKISNQKMVLIK